MDRMMFLPHHSIVDENTADSYGTFLRQNHNLGGCRNMFQLFLNVLHFKPNEIEVKILDDYIVVHGKHEERFDEDGFICREFTRRYKVPTDIERTTIKSVYKENGVLEIRALKKISLQSSANEMIIKAEVPKILDLESMKETSVHRQLDVKDSPAEGSATGISPAEGSATGISPDEESPILPVGRTGSFTLSGFGEFTYVIIQPFDLNKSIFQQSSCYELTCPQKFLDALEYIEKFGLDP